MCARKIGRWRRVGALALLAGTWLAAGCGDQRPTAPTVAEKDEPVYQHGKQLLQAEHPDEALPDFLAVIRRRPDDCALSHLEAGQIYLKSKNPLAAIYHFQEFLAAKPKADESKVVRQLIDSATKDFAMALPGQPAVGEFDRVALQDKVRLLEGQVATLQRQLSEAQMNHVTSIAVATTPVEISVGTPPPTRPDLTRPTPPPRDPTPAPTATARTYKVVAGDNLYAISTKVYGNGGRYMEIYNANRDQLAKPDSTLHAGQELKIP